MKGGEDARHRSSQAADKIYTTVYPEAEEPLTNWDLFHREEAACQRAVNEAPLAVEVFDVGQVMLQLFGVGSGRVLHRGVGALLADETERATIVRPSEGGATRPMAYSHRVCNSLVRNYRSYHAGLEARAAQTRGEASDGRKRGAQSLVKLVDVGRRLAAMDFVVFFFYFGI